MLPANVPAVALSAVSRAFGVAPGIVRIDFTVERGEVVLIRGPNGSGKTTLLRVIATALSPTSGRGAVLGFDLLEGREEIRRRTELLGHRTRLYEDLTVAENLRFACTLFQIDPRRVLEVLDQVGLNEVARERVRRLSQGMRQRTALARALLRQPDLLLLDEPYGALDRQARQLIDDVIRAAREGGRTVVLATHDTAQASLATRIVFMQGGRLYSRPADTAATGEQRP